MWDSLDHSSSILPVVVLLCTAVAVGTFIAVIHKLTARVWRSSFPPGGPAAAAEKFCQDSDCRGVNPPAARFCRRCGATLVPVSRRMGRWLGRIRVQSSGRASA